jgi:hypothetical protein
MDCGSVTGSENGLRGAFLPPLTSENFSKFLNWRLREVEQKIPGQLLQAAPHCGKNCPSGQVLIAMWLPRAAKVALRGTRFEAMWLPQKFFPLKENCPISRRFLTHS